jgi:uncharacterized protein (TIGR00369 family)
VKKIEAIRGLITGEMELPPAGQTLGMKVVEVEEGTVTVEMPVDERFSNRSGALQGGIIAAVADAAMGISLGATEEVEESHVTLEFKVNFVRPGGPERSPLRATGRVLYRGRSFAHTDCDVLGSDGELVAKATGSWIIRRSE